MNRTTSITEIAKWLEELIIFEKATNGAKDTVKFQTKECYIKESAEKNGEQQKKS